MFDGCIICSNCALFGSHKGHEVIDPDGLIRNLTETAEICLDLYDRIQECWKQNGKKALEVKYQSIICNKRQSIQDKIKEYYDSIYEKIRKQRDQNLS